MYVLDGAIKELCSFEATFFLEIYFIDWGKIDFLEYFLIPMSTKKVASKPQKSLKSIRF